MAMSDVSNPPQRVLPTRLGIASLAVIAAAGVTAAPIALAAKTRTLSASGQLVRTAKPSALSACRPGPSPAGRSARAGWSCARR